MDKFVNKLKSILDGIDDLVITVNQTGDKFDDPDYGDPEIYFNLKSESKSLDYTFMNWEYRHNDCTDIEDLWYHDYPKSGEITMSEFIEFFNNYSTNSEDRLELLLELI